MSGEAAPGLKARMRCLAARHGALLRFAVVGGSGFLVDIALFHSLWQGMGWPLPLARSLAFLAAVTTTWQGNCHWTFGAVGAGRLELTRYLSLILVASVPNLVVFTLISSLWPTGFGPYLALVAGIASGMVVNFLGCERWVFARVRAADPRGQQSQ